MSVKKSLYFRSFDQVTGQSIAAGATYVKSIALPDADFRQGFSMLVVPTALVNAPSDRKNMLVMYSTALAEACCQSTHRVEYTYYDYYNGSVYWEDWAHVAHFRARDVDLSFYEFRATGSGDIGLRDARINGLNLELTFRNNHATQSATLRVDIESRVYREESFHEILGGI